MHARLVLRDSFKASWDRLVARHAQPVPSVLQAGCLRKRLALRAHTTPALERLRARLVLRGSFKTAADRLVACRVVLARFAVKAGFALRRLVLRAHTTRLLVLLRAILVDWASTSPE
jgi:hypothetical protein